MSSNNTSSSSLDCQRQGSRSLDTAISCLYFLTFPAALVLNAGAAWVSLHLRSTSTFVVYLKNLVVADLLMTLTLPAIAAGRLPGTPVWFRAALCRYLDVIFFCSLYTSITLMGVISLDRFFKIVRPRGRLLGQSLAFSRASSASVWVVIFGGTAVPTFILTDLRPGNATGDFCMSLKGPHGVRFHQGVVLFSEALFWFVGAVVVICYICITHKVLQSFRNSGSNNSRGQRKTKLRVFLVLLVFFTCFMPLHIMRVPFTQEQTEEVCSFWLEAGNTVALWLSSTNVCLDPLLYIYLCKEFNDKLVEMINDICTKAHKHIK